MHVLMKKSTEPSRGEMNKASTTEAKLSSKAEYFEKLRKEGSYMHVAVVAISVFQLVAYVTCSDIIMRTH